MGRVSPVFRRLWRGLCGVVCMKYPAGWPHLGSPCWWWGTMSSSSAPYSSSFCVTEVPQSDLGKSVEAVIPMPPALPPSPRLCCTVRWSSPDKLLEEKQQRPGIQLPLLAGPIQQMAGGSWACDRANGLVLQEGSTLWPLAWLLERGHCPAFLHFFSYLFFLLMIIDLIIWIIIMI